MYCHHARSIDNLKKCFTKDKEVLSIILGGSVAKGTARADSDIDAIIVVSDGRYRELERESRLCECIMGHCTYEGGYFDIKYCTVAFLESVAVNGSEPSRNAFLGSCCIYSSDPAIPLLLSKIPVFQIGLKADKMLSFYSAFNLNYGYFWGASSGNPYLRARAATDIVLFGYRMLLQEREVLFPSQKGLLHAMEELEQKPEGIVEKGNLLLSRMDDSSKDSFVSSILEFIKYHPPADYNEVLTRYIDDNELWWYKQRPLIAEW